jgi:hypothetical protein
MKRILTLVLLMIILVVISGLIGDLFSQGRRGPLKDLEQRVEDLEKRVTDLEDTLFLMIEEDLLGEEKK